MRRANIGLISISKMNEVSKKTVAWLEVDESGAQQRIDNFLVKHLKGVPKSHIYRILRSGEIRVNSKRVDSGYRLCVGDKLRIPPVRTAQRRDRDASGPVAPLLAGRILYEDDCLLVVDKPAGMAVHGGSGVSLGLVEQLRLERPDAKFIELAHRLDRETSGVLLLAKKRSALTAVHRAMREGAVEKRYLALVKGGWRDKKRNARFPLHKYVTSGGERRVSVHEDGRPAHTVFFLRQSWPEFSLLEAELKTGRTHQIRVHLAHLGFPIAGDAKYGDFAWNRALQKLGLKRMFLHARELILNHPSSGGRLVLEAPLPEDLHRFLDGLGRRDQDAGETREPNHHDK